MNFSHMTPQRVFFGYGTLSNLGTEAARLGQRALLVTGKGSARRTGALQKTRQRLEAAGIVTHLFEEVEPEPSLATTQKGIEAARQQQVDLVVGLGGGSAIDVAKLIAALAPLPGTLQAYFDGKEPEQKGLPFLAIPTTAGTGTEVTRVSVVTDTATGEKKGVRHDDMLPDVTLVDPELTLSCPPAVTAHSGMDALTQAIEAFVSKGANPLTDAIAQGATELIGKNLLKAYQNGQDRDARANVMLGSTMAGIALNNARLGVVHGLAHPVGSLYNLPHGLVCAILLPHVIRFNSQDPAVVQKFKRLAATLGVPDLLSFVEELNRALQIPAGLGAVGLQEADIADLARQTLPSGSTQSNPVAVGQAEAEAILRANL